MEDLQESEREHASLGENLDQGNSVVHATD